MNENQKNMTLDEYYTISAHGIVHVFTDKGKKNRVKNYYILVFIL